MNDTYALKTRDFFYLFFLVILFSTFRLWSFDYFSGSTSDPLFFHVDDDARRYFDGARSLVETSVYKVSPESETIAAFSPPGYAFLIAIVKQINGLEYVDAIKVQIVLSAVCIALLYLLLIRIQINQKISLATASIFGLEPMSHYYSQVMLTESVFTLLILLMLYLIIRFHQSEYANTRLALLIGVALACATMFRSISYYYVVFLIPLLFFSGRFQNISYSGIFKKCLVIVIPLVIVFGGWQYRNLVQIGTSEFSLVGVHNLLYYRASAVLAKRNGTSRGEEIRKVDEEIESLAGGKSLGELYSARKKLAVSIILDHPIHYATVAWESALKLLFDPGYDSYVRRYFRYVDKFQPYAPPLQGLVSATDSDVNSGGLYASNSIALIYIYCWLSLLFIYALALLGLIRRKLDFPFILIVITLGYFVLLSSGPAAYSRFRMPMIPMFMILAAYGMHNILSFWQNHRANSI